MAYYPPPGYGGYPPPMMPMGAPMGMGMPMGAPMGMGMPMGAPMRTFPFFYCPQEYPLFFYSIRNATRYGCSSWILLEQEGTYETPETIQDAQESLQDALRMLVLRDALTITLIKRTLDPFFCCLRKTSTLFCEYM